MKESIKKGIKHVKVPVKFTHFYWVIHLKDLSRIYTGLGGLLLEINKSRCFLKKLSKVIESNEYINILVSSKKLHMVFISGYKGKTGSEMEDLLVTQLDYVARLCWSVFVFLLSPVIVGPLWQCG